MQNHRIRRSLAPLVIAAPLVVGAAPAAWSAPAPSTHAGESSVQAFPPCSNPPIAIAQWWKRSGWVRNGNVNKQYRIKDGGNVHYIWGGKTYKNVSSPRLPNGTYNEYDVTPHSRPNAPRDAQRLVRRLNGDLYYTRNHYKSFCDMGGGW